MSRQQPKPVTIFVTSRALTQGIVAIEAYPVGDTEGYMYGQSLGGLMAEAYYGPGSYRMTMAEAIARARQMQAKRIVRMEKQLAALRALNFDEVAE